MLINQDSTQDRTKYLGGSDIGALLGLSKFRSPLDVWMEKTGKPLAAKEFIALRFGSFAESFVASEYARATGFALLHDESTYIHPKHSFMSAHIDRFVLGDGPNKPATRLLECKTANPFAQSEWGAVGTDEVPMGYLCQCAWYMAITQIGQIDLAVLFGNSDFRIYEITRDLELEELILAKATAFWENQVLKDIPPAPQSEKEYQALFSKGNPQKTVEATPEIVNLIRALQALNLDIQAKEHQTSQIKQSVMAQMQDAEILSFEGKILATWKAPKASFRLDSKRLELEHPQLIANYQVPIQNSRRLVFKELKEIPSPLPVEISTLTTILA